MTPVPASDRSGLTRRTVLRRATLAAAAWSAPAVLAACGSSPEPGPQERAVTARSIGIDYASYYAPVAALQRLIAAHAERRGALPTFSDDAAGAAAQRATLERWFDPKTGFRAVVVAPFDAAALRQQVTDATAAGIVVVGYVAPLPGASAAIVVDPAEAAARLARQVAAWTARRADGRGQLLLVRPAAGAAVPDPLRPLAAPAERALLARLRADVPGLRTVAAVEALARDDAAAAVTAALERYPDVRTVLTWNDTTAVGAAAALRAHARPADRARLYVGAIAAGGPTGRETLTGLADDGPLRCVAAPALRDLAAAMIDLPLARLRGGGPARTLVPVRTLTAGSTALRAARADLAERA